MAVLELLRVAVFPLQTLLLLAAAAAHDSGRHQELLEGLAECPALLALQALHLLQAGCLDKAAAAVAQHAVHTPLALVV